MEDLFGQTSRPFVAGFMRGYRAWKVNTNGTSLMAVSRGEQWQPGRNVAACGILQTLKQNRDGNVGWAAALPNCPCPLCKGVSNDVYARRAREDLDKRIAALEAHQVPSIATNPCNNCGFWGMHSPDLRTHGSNYIPFGRSGVLDALVIEGSIKATGIVVIGTLGLRCQYAEVEALAGEHSEPFGKLYGVPVYPTMQALVKDFPPDPTYATAHIADIVAEDWGALKAMTRQQQYLSMATKRWPPTTNYSSFFTSGSYNIIPMPVPPAEE